jgi:predicted transposase YdaD
MSPYVVALPGKEIITHHFDVVRLWELDPAPILTGGLSGLVPIVPLMRGARPEQLPTLAEQVLELPELNALQRGDLVSMLATFGALRFPRIDIWEVLRSSTMLSELMNELIQDSPFLRKIHDDAEVHGREEGREAGREEGREAGREAGREEGRLLEARSMLREMAQARFPEIRDADLAGIDSIASVERLHALIRATVSSDSAQSLLLAVGEALG